MAKLSGKGLFFIALILALVTGGLIYSYLNGVTTEPAKPQTQVVVAKVDIPVKTIITADMVQEITIPLEYIQPGAMTTMASVVGVMSREPVTAGEQITPRLLVTAGKTTGFASLIPSDKRALTISVNEVTGVAGFIKPGDYVDMIMTFDRQDVGSHTSQVMLQNLQVLAINREIETGSLPGEAPAKDKDAKENGAKSLTVTLAVADDQAAEVTLAEEKGKIRLALRPTQPTDGVVVTTPQTPQGIVGMHVVVGETPAPQAPTTTPATVAPTPSNETYAPVKSQPSVVIQTIRGTKVEVSPVN